MKFSYSITNSLTLSRLKYTIIQEFVMFVNNFFLMGNPFIDAYVQSDFLGKLIFIGLLLLSVASWILIAQRGG